MNRKIRKNFTLLEVMVAIVLLAVAGGALAWKCNALLERKKFSTDVGRIKQGLLQARMMALNTRSDWEFVLEKEKKGWSSQLRSREEGSGPLFLTQQGKAGPFSLFLNGKEVNQCVFVFYSTGLVEPDVTIKFKGSQAADECTLSGLTGILRK